MLQTGRCRQLPWDQEQNSSRTEMGNSTDLRLQCCWHGVPVRAGDQGMAAVELMRYHQLPQCEVKRGSPPSKPWEQQQSGLFVQLLDKS